jgi:Leucine-rich repeat (LRR) protein
MNLIIKIRNGKGGKEVLFNVRCVVNDEHVRANRYMDIDTLYTLLLNNIDTEVIPPEIGYLTSLTNLKLGYNRFQRLPEEFKNLIFRISSEGV